MTESQTQEPPTGVTTWDETMARTVAALNDARRAGFDMGEFICHTVTAAAANAGGAEELLSVRTGSWEADYVRQIIRSTAGEDLADLLRHRTEPVRIYLHVDAIVGPSIEFDLGQMADEEAGAADQAVQSLWEQVPDECWEIDPDRHIEDLPEGWTQPRKLRADLTPDQRAAFEAAKTAQEQADALGEKIEAMHDADEAAYVAALRAAVVEIVTERGLPAELFEVVNDYRPESEPIGWDELGEVVLLIEDEEAAARAVIPVLGRARRDIEGSVSDALRAAGLSYTERVAAEREEGR